ncbi:MAG: glycosyltransferase [Candidatus Omnitrophica bacterium]|nr:glycosyltransferase [Candidatus Omnitrophota bacterium]
MKKMKVSVVIRNRNEARYLEKILYALSLQRVPPDEIIVVDNASEDNSAEVAARAQAKLVSIDTKTFTYGRALNRGIREASGEICVVLSAHTLPVGRNFIEECLVPFEDERIAGVRCVHGAKQRDLEEWISPQVLRSPVDPEKVIAYGPGCGYAIRRSVWQEIPFEEDLEMIEDKAWAWEVLRNGYHIYSACPAVYTHIRPRRTLEKIWRTNQEGRAVYRRFARRFPVRSPMQAIGGIVAAVCWRAPRAAVSVLVTTIGTHIFSLMLPIIARKKASQGSRPFFEVSRSWKGSKKNE